MCAPSTIGHVAKTAYRRKLVMCARQSQKKYRETSTRRKIVPTILRQHPPSELQFISLFGYLQTQCHTRPNENCTNEDYESMTRGCEDDIRQRSQLSNSDLDRHQLLRIKLDASSRLLPYTETKRADECLMVRSSLSDIFQIHQKYCLQTIVTRCMCERLNFEYFCDIECSRLEPTGLPLYQQLLWDEFKGRLASNGYVNNAQFLINLMFVVLVNLL
ncbi:unnamed protein product [Bursaphelenchus okinawaensis]|uniref:Uncharacterized protein n=1 Tax=Bursaphelenchus okinawaensis TaxID=465554 RepID=A0A811KR39_9BILA|nr:unnamed protein product [Bursaphelenchus okinawaensis]CAG9108446.1 unnamed protein product [Bursaphelenchus okinawaensis]